MTENHVHGGEARMTVGVSGRSSGVSERMSAVRVELNCGSLSTVKTVHLVSVVYGSDHPLRPAKRSMTSGFLWWRVASSGGVGTIRRLKYWSLARSSVAYRFTVTPFLQPLSSSLSTLRRELQPHSPSACSVENWSCSRGLSSCLGILGGVHIRGV